MFLRSEALQQLREKCCPFTGTPLPDEGELLLISRHRLLKSNTMFLGVGTVSHREYEVQACYVPISEAIAEQAHSVERLGDVSIRLLFAGLGVLALAMILGFTGLLERMGRVGEVAGIVLGAVILVLLLLSGLVLGLKSLRRTSFSRKLLIPSSSGWKYGLPDNVLQDCPFVTTANSLDAAK